MAQAPQLKKLGNQLENPDAVSRTTTSNAGLSREQEGRPASNDSFFFGMKTRVFIVDDHELVRRGLTTAINAETDMEACGSAEDSVSALTMIRRLLPDVVIVDISLRCNASIDLIRRIRAFSQRIQIICLSMRDHPADATKLIQAGAREYLVKQGVVGRVTDAIRRIQGKKKANAESVSDRPRTPTGRSAHPFEWTAADYGLTETECEIVELMGRGLPTQGIASVLHLSVNMVEMYRRNIMARLRLRDPARLVQFCVDSVRGRPISVPRGQGGLRREPVMG
jgi:DNA-binding NarL/FixJ family response regulator